MMLVSLMASCLRMPNISSCLRMVEAFSTSFSSAKARSSDGVLDLRSWSVISRMRVSPGNGVGGDENARAKRRGEGGESQVCGKASGHLPDVATVRIHGGGCPLHQPAFREISRKYEKTLFSASGDADFCTGWGSFKGFQRAVGRP